MTDRPVDLGDPWPDLGIEIRNSAGVLEDATAVALTITAPSGATPVLAETVPSISPGVYVRDFIPDATGWWKADWRATGLNTSAHTQWVHVVTRTAWAPTPQDVHALIPQRPMFTDSSRPSLTEVGRLIVDASDSLLAEVTDTLPERFYGKAALVAALNAASLVEQQFFPEQQLGEGPYDRLYQRYKDELVGLRALLGDAEGDGPGGAFTAFSPVQAAIERLYPPVV